MPNTPEFIAGRATANTGGSSETPRSTYPNLPELIAAEKASESKAPFLSLALETRAAVETACAAYHLNRADQTLRIWASRETGPIRPYRVFGRLMWPTARLRELCGVAV